jgi:hypothetical protein
MADRGLFDEDRLREYKHTDLSVQDVKARFEWATSKQLIRLGGFYTTPQGTLVLRGTGHFPFFSFNENEEGLLELTFMLQSEQGQVLAEMQNNMFSATPPQLFDIHVDPGGSRIKIRVARSDVVLDLRSTRITVDKLDEMLREDWGRWVKFRNMSAKSRSTFRTWQEVYVPSIPQFSSPKILGAHPYAMKSPEAVVPSEAESEVYRDSVVEGVMRYANSYLKDKNNSIKLLNLQALVTHDSGRKYQVHDAPAVGFSAGGLGLGFGTIIAGHRDGP